MPNIDHFSHAISAVAGARASGLKIADGAVSLMLDVSGLNADARAQIEADVRSAVEQAGAMSVRIMLTAERITPRLIAVASGKGGVGKSTLSTNLAIANVHPRNPRMQVALELEEVQVPPNLLLGVVRLEMALHPKLFILVVKRAPTLEVHENIKPSA